MAVDISDATTLHLQAYRACGPQADDVFIDDETLRRVGAAPTVDVNAVEMLVSMGFPPVQAAHALRQTGNAGAEIALNWILANPDAVPEEDVSSTRNQGAVLFSIFHDTFTAVFFCSETHRHTRV
jgi:uncharacterized UBP type Zn finger protein